MSLIEKDGLRYEPALQNLAQELLNGRCVLFLGAGASINSLPPSVLTGTALSKMLAAECKLDWHDYIPLSTIAFYYESFFTRNNLNALLTAQFNQDSIPPSATIERLIDIVAILERRNKRTLTITTNYDRHFERAYHSKFGRSPEVVIYRGGWNPNEREVRLHYDLQGNPISSYWTAEALTTLYKMHGCISQVIGQSLVITEEDYINFLTNALGEKQENRLLYQVRGKLESSTILFIGYSLADWNFRTIFKATVERRENKDTRSYAVQLHQPKDRQETERFELMRDFWHNKGVDIINVPAIEFAADLLRWVRDKAGEPNPVLAKPAVHAGQVGRPLDIAPMAVAGGAGPYTFSVSSGKMPGGLELNPSTGAITGTPSTADSFTVQVTDGNGNVATGACPLRFDVLPAEPVAAGPVAR